MDASVSPSYCLAPHVYACRTGSHVVLLDLKRDRYIGVRVADLGTLAQHIVHWPVDGALAEDGVPDPEHADVLREMLDHGMLMPASANARSHRAAALPRPERALIDGYVRVRTTIAFPDVARFSLAIARARILLRYRSLEEVIGGIVRRHQTRPQPELDLERAQRCVATFYRLRVFLYSEYNACLFSSLAVLNFLELYGISPRLVVGVTTSPFKAHCWLQHREVIVNDAPERVREYTPILVA